MDTNFIAFTTSGAKVTLTEGTPTVRDMAIAMSRLARYAGNSDTTVLAHSFVVHDILKDAGFDDRICFLGLVHDVSESILGEAPKGTKSPEYKSAELALEKRIFSDRFKAPFFTPEEKAAVKFADRQAQLAECVIVGPPGLAEYSNAEERVSPESLAAFRSVVNSGFGEFGKQKGINDFVVDVFMYLRKLGSVAAEQQIQEEDARLPLPFGESNGIRDRAGSNIIS